MTMSTDQIIAAVAIQRLAEITSGQSEPAELIRRLAWITTILTKPTDGPEAYSTRQRIRLLVEDVPELAARLRDLGVATKDARIGVIATMTEPTAEQLDEIAEAVKGSAYLAECRAGATGLGNDDIPF